MLGGGLGARLGTKKLEGIETVGGPTLKFYSHYRCTTNPLTGEDSHNKCDPQAYLQAYLTDDRLQVQSFVMKQVHTFYQSYKSSETKLKILDVGSGPVISHAISAAPYASEIVL